MKLYWANAKTEDLELLTTYDGCLKFSEAINQFQLWREYGYRLKEMWVQVYENGKIIRNIKISDMRRQTNE